MSVEGGQICLILKLSILRFCCIFLSFQLLSLYKSCSSGGGTLQGGFPGLRHQKIILCVPTLRSMPFDWEWIIVIIIAICQCTGDNGTCSQRNKYLVIMDQSKTIKCLWMYTNILPVYNEYTKLFDNTKFRPTNNYISISSIYNIFTNRKSISKYLRNILYI